MQFYSINARSRRLNILKRCLDEDELGGTRTTDEALAQLKAQAFADRLNKTRVNSTDDWRGEVIEINSPFVKKNP
jgi:hypothetical protein